MSQWSMLRILLRVAIILLRSNHLSLEISIVMLPIIRILMQQTFWLGWKLVWWKGKLLQINWNICEPSWKLNAKHRYVLIPSCVTALIMICYKRSCSQCCTMYGLWQVEARSTVVIVSSSMSSCSSDCSNEVLHGIFMLISKNSTPSAKVLQPSVINLWRYQVHLCLNGDRMTAWEVSISWSSELACLRFVQIAMLWVQLDPAGHIHILCL